MTDLERHGTASEQTAAPRATVPLAGTLALVAGGFGVLGLLEGSGGALWPDVLDDFGISKGFYGVASGIGLTLAFPVLFYGGRLTTRFDKALLIAFAGVLLGAATFGLTTGAGAALFVVLMAARGVGIALLDMSANALAMDVEQRTGRHLMSPLHSGFSAGTMVGAGIAWIAFALGGDHVAVYVLMTALLALFVAGAVTVWRRSPVVRTRTEVAGASGASFRLLRLPRVRALAVITGIAFCGELLIAQWIGLYLRDERGYGASVGVRAVILLGGAMFLGRLVNGPITERLGSRVALLLQGSVLTAGALLIVAGTSAAPIVIGCGVAGIGLAGLAPTALSLAGLALPSSSGAAAGATLIGGYVGVALIPFLAGLLASLLSVRVVLGIEIVFGVVVVAMALWLPHLLSGEQQAIRAVAVEPGARA